MSDTQKQQNRIMGEYSIAKSYKGILRIAHIVDLVTSERDQFLNPMYYGSPKQLLNISGGTFASKQKGVQSAAHSLKGDNTITRYNIPEDELKNRRVPMTDSMGNFLNWWVGSDGVTIGSNEDINDSYLGHSVFYQTDYTNYPIYQEKFFPVLQSNKIIIGQENKLYSSDKIKVNDSSLHVQGKLIIQNLYEKTKASNNIDKGYRYSTLTDGTIMPEEVELRNYNTVVGNGKKYKKLRTIYNNTKQTSQDYDTFMYRQNDWDCQNYGAGHVKNGEGEDNWIQDVQKLKDFKIITTDQYENSVKYNKQLVADVSGNIDLQNDTFYTKGQVLDCNVDIVNLQEYVLNAIKKFSQDNIVEVPSGTVIWQYCSLDKWRAYGDIGTGGKPNFSGSGVGNFTGHRPTLENRTGGIKNDDEENSEIQNMNIFSSSTLQGASKKINHLLRANTEEQPVQDKQDEAVLIQDYDSYHHELIPLYKRDYVLCDGSVYRIPYYPNFKSKNLSTLKEHKDRFFELFFNIGYRYTDRKHLINRPSVKFDSQSGIVYVLNNQNEIITHSICNEVKQPSSYNTTSQVEWKTLSDPPIYNLWGGKGAPSFNNQPLAYKNLDDMDVLFGEDLATMLAIDLIYDEFMRVYDSTGKYMNYEQLRNWCKNTDSSGKELGRQLPQQYIFNSFIGDNNENMKLYWQNSFHYGLNDENYPQTMTVHYTDSKLNQYKINIGREVNNLNSFIKFYDVNAQLIRIVKVYDLPMVNFCMELLASSMNREINLRKYFYTYYNYDFQVPTLLAEDNSPAFIGSCGWADSDENRCKMRKVVQWYTRYSHSTRPHRHGMFAGKSILNNLNEKTVPEIYAAGQISTTKPVNIAGYWGCERFNFPNWNKKGGTKGKITEKHGNYIINQFYVKTDNVDVNGMNVKVLVNDGANSKLAGDVLRNRYGWKTGTFRTATPNDTVITQEQGVQNPSIIVNTDIPLQSKAPKVGWTDKWDENTTIQTLQDYYRYNRPAWYSLLPKEDSRFDTSEPNRGISSPPIANLAGVEITYQKIKDNAKGYYTGKNSINLGFFSPEHITMLPLIKI